MAAATPLNSLDPNSFAALRRQSHDNSPAAIKATSQQFEALFVQQMLKSMRDATPKESMMDNDATRMYQSMLDQQLSVQLSTQNGGIGLAKVIEHQLSVGKDPVLPPDGPVPLNGGLRRPAASSAAAASAAPASLPSMPPGAGPRAFVERVWPQAVEASRATGIPAQFLVAQAALETGWGKHELKNPDGSSSNNLFNIKAGKSWSGATVNTATMEHRNGTVSPENASFRAYGSYAESFKDYARMIGSNPRYAGVVGQTDATAFARGLQHAGYATDPQYADKLARIINGNTLRTALAASATKTA